MTDTKWPGPIRATAASYRPGEDQVYSEHALINVGWAKPDHAKLVAIIGDLRMEFDLTRQAADALAQGLLGVARLIEYRKP